MNKLTTLRRVPQPDYAAIEIKLTESGRTRSAWAMSRGIKPESFRRYMTGTITPSGAHCSPTFDKVVRELKRDKLWVEIKKKAKAA